MIGFVFLHSPAPPLSSDTSLTVISRVEGEGVRLILENTSDATDRRKHEPTTTAL